MTPEESIWHVRDFIEGFNEDDNKRNLIFISTVLFSYMLEADNCSLEISFSGTKLSVVVENSEE